MPSTKKTTKAEAARLWDSQALSLAMPWFFTSFSSSALASMLRSYSNWICWLSLDWLPLPLFQLAMNRDSGQVLPNRAYTELHDRALLSLSSWATLCCKVDSIPEEVGHTSWYVMCTWLKLAFLHKLTTHWCTSFDRRFSHEGLF